MRQALVWGLFGVLTAGTAHAQAPAHVSRAAPPSDPAADPAAPAQEGAQDRDPWFGRDKLLHFGASAVLAAGGHAAGSAVYDERGMRLWVGADLALSAGIVKELMDLWGAGEASWRDLAWDVLGTGAGLLVAWLADRFIFAPPGRTPAARQAQPLRAHEPRRAGFGLSLRF